jgi:Fe2+ transport system protein FeoA
MNLAELALGAVARVAHVGGSGSFRRRLMELGILPGTRVELVSIAPLGDPLELLVRGASLSIRREQAESVEVSVAPLEALEETLEPRPALDSQSLRPDLGSPSIGE